MRAQSMGGVAGRFNGRRLVKRHARLVTGRACLASVTTSGSRGCLCARSVRVPSPVEHWVPGANINISTTLAQDFPHSQHRIRTHNHTQWHPQLEERESVLPHLHRSQIRPNSPAKPGAPNQKPSLLMKSPQNPRRKRRSQLSKRPRATPKSRLSTPKMSSTLTR